MGFKLKLGLIKISLEKNQLVIMAISRLMDYEQAVTQTSIYEETTSEVTLADRYIYCREIYLLEPDARFRINETKIGKCNLDRMMEGTYLL